MENFERFTEDARRMLAEAQECARSLNHDFVGSQHLLLSILADDTRGICSALVSVGVTYDAARAALPSYINRSASRFTDSFGYTTETRKLLEHSLYEAKTDKSTYIDTVHILRAMLRDKGSAACNIICDMGADSAALLSSLGSASFTRTERHTDSPAVSGTTILSSTPVLDTYSRDMTELAKRGALDPVIGRDSEIERVIQILCRRTKNNPVLIGDPGVGKSAVVEGLAQCIVSGNAPDLISGKRVVSLDIASMLAGTKFRGEFEERMSAVITELRTDRRTILFIDELHTIVGAGGSEGSIDASNMLKPVLARGELQMVGATTIAEYRKRIESDAALERRFQPVHVNEPTESEAVRILLGLRPRYEAHHNTKITDEAVNAAVRLSVRYIPDRFLPDKAIDLMDEAASRVRLSAYTTPPDMKRLEDKLRSLLREKESAVDSQDYERAAAIRDEEKGVRDSLDALLCDAGGAHSAAASTVTENDVAAVVSAWTMIPVGNLLEDERARLLKLEDELHKQIIGQDEAVAAVSRALRRAATGLRDSKRPIGAFMFAGPTGVGKTELAKSLARILFANEDAVIRLDMSEYAEAHSISKLIGSPPGYVGFGEGGYLTERVRRTPYSVVLLDELEKAHPDVFNMLLQVLDDGRLTDSGGRTVDFKNTILIMTTNAGADRLTRPAAGFASFQDAAKETERAYETMLSALKKQFPAEFINRIDEIVLFRPLDIEQAKRVTELMLKSSAERLNELGVSLECTDEAVSFLSSAGFDQVYGARPLRRVIQRLVEDPLSEQILSGELTLPAKVLATFACDRLLFTKC